MADPEWSLHDAKNRFSALVEQALHGGPQRVTRRGKPAVVVIAAEEYEQLRRLGKSTAPAFGELLLTMPQDDLDFDRIPLRSRAIDL